MITKKRNKKSGNKPLTFKAVLRVTGMVIICIILLIAPAERIWHYFHHHLTK